MDTFTADIEIISGCLRVFKNNAVPGKDPYEFAATIVFTDGGKTAELKGVTSTRIPMISFRDVIIDKLWSCGVETLMCERKKGDSSRVIKIDLASYRKKRSRH